VGSFEANEFNLHDMHGNVWEWVVDCYNDNYANVPFDGEAASERAGCSRVVRGGSWYYGPRNLRAASRLKFTPDVRNDGVGFRVARTLDPTVLKR
jgi:formylglycine-generating enzyme required for sulfatase activity